MKCYSPAEPANYLYLDPSQPVGMEEEDASLTDLQAQSADALCKPAGEHPPAIFSVWFTGRKKKSTGKQSWLLTAVVLWCLLRRDVFCLQKSEADSHITAEIIRQAGFNLMGGKADGFSTPSIREGHRGESSTDNHSCAITTKLT